MGLIKFQWAWTDSFWLLKGQLQSIHYSEKA